MGILRPGKVAVVAGSDDYLKGYHEGDSGGLDAIDTDLAVGNIKKDVVIFGKTGTVEEGALAEDILGEASTAEIATSSSGWFNTYNITTVTEVTLATKTQAYDASSLAVGVAWGNLGFAQANAAKVRLYMEGVLVAESAFIPIGPVNYAVLGTRALSGSQTCSIRVYNSFGATKALWLGGVWEDGAAAAGIAVGSIKLA